MKVGGVPTASDNSIEEWDIRQWFLKAELQQAIDTYRVVGGIIEARLDAKPKRKRRSDAGSKRQGSLAEQMENDGTYEKPDIR